MRAEAASPAEINREHPAQALHPGHGCRGSVVVGFAVSFAQRMSADLRVAATPAARCGWDNLASMLGVWGQYPVISDQVAAWPRHQRRQPSQEVQRVKHVVRGAIAVRCLQLVTCPSPFVLSRSSASADLVT